MDAPEIPFGEFLPSAPDYKNPGCVVADNCVPVPGGYGPLRTPELSASSFTGECRGAQLFFSDDTAFIAGGTTTTLFTKVGATLDSDGGYTDVPAGDSWDFAQFGNMIIATSISNAPQHLADYTAATTWAALTGSPPMAKYCERIGDFLMLGNLSTAANGIAWSSFNAPASSWTASRLTQAGSAELPLEFGAVQALTGGRYGLVFQERAVSLLQYVGPPTVWNRQEVETERGTIAPASVVTTGFRTYFLAQDGFYVTNGSDSHPIGGSRVNGWFFDNANQALLHLTHASVDWLNECVVWAFVGQGQDLFNRLLVYSWAENRWSSGTVTIQRLVGSRRDATSLEDLDALFPGGLETVTPSLDSPSWSAGARVLAAFVDDGSDTTYATFDGDTLEATWQTGAFQPVPGRRAFVNGVYPIFEAADDAVECAAVGYTNSRTPMVGAYSAPAADGACPVRVEGLMLGAAVRRTSGSVWTKAMGVQMRGRQAGGR